MKSLQKRRSTALILAVAWLAVCLVLTLAMGQTKATEDYEIKLLAAQKLQGWMDDIRDYKLEAGLSLTPYDTHKTGMIGDEYTPITTSLGSEEAKRTHSKPGHGRTAGADAHRGRGKVRRYHRRGLFGFLSNVESGCVGGR